MRRPICTILLIIIILLSAFSFTACDDGIDYTCGYCGTKMGHYYDYVGGEYTCYRCSKVFEELIG